MGKKKHFTKMRRYHRLRVGHTLVTHGYLMNNSIYLQSNFANRTPFFDPVHRPGKCATRKLWRCASLDIEIAVKWLSTYQHSWHICKHKLFSDIWTIKRVILLLVNRDLKICLAYTVIWHTIRLRLFHIGWSDFIQRRIMEYQQHMMWTCKRILGLRRRSRICLWLATPVEKRS